MFTKIKLLSYQGKYEELYQFCARNKNIIIKREMKDAYFYSKKMTNRLDSNRRGENSYLFSQIVKYEETIEDLASINNVFIFSISSSHSSIVYSLGQDTALQENSFNN